MRVTEIYKRLDFLCLFRSRERERERERDLIRNLLRDFFTVFRTKNEWGMTTIRGPSAKVITC